MATWKDIVNAAQSLYNQRDKYCYFYGAKHVLLTDERMNALWNAEPAYFARYSAVQKTAIFNYSRGKIGLDCSGYVCLVLETAGIITRSQWTYSTALIGKCTDVTTNISATPAGSLLYSTFHNAGRHIGVDGGNGYFYDIGVEGDTIRHMKIADWGKWEKAGKWVGVDYSGAIGGIVEASTRLSQPEGYLDYVDKDGISGWAYDGTDEPLTVHIYIYKDGQRVDLFSVTANAFRSDLKSAGKGNGNHAFSVNYDFVSRLGAGSYMVKAYAINKAGYVNPQLQGVKTVNITQTSTYKQWVGAATTAVYVRTTPDPNGDIYTAWPMLGEGNLVDIIGEAKAPDGGTWYQVLIAKQHKGYVNAKYIRKA